jgi:elongation factor Ts
MSITASEVNKLRQVTGAGMMDCKKALTEAEGDFDKAIENLRKKGQKVSDARADREASEGSVFAISSDDKTTAALLELNCETDFVARNEDFQNMGTRFIRAAFSFGATDAESAKALVLEGRTIQEYLTDAMGRIGEKIDIRRYVTATSERVITYIHPGARVGVLVAFDGVAGVDMDTVGKDVAMQIAAMKPVSVDKEDVPAELAAKELEIGREVARAEGKPEAMLDKIAQGKLAKFFKEQTLMNQEFVKDSSITIAQYLKNANPNLKVKAFYRVQLGTN